MQKLDPKAAFDRAIGYVDALGINVTPSMERQVLALVLACEEGGEVSWARCTDRLQRRFPALWQALKGSEIRA